MSDLQCPATFVLLTPDSLPALDATPLRIAAVYVHDRVEPVAQAELQRLAAAHGCEVEHTHGELLTQIEQLADVHRGETVLLLAPPYAVAAALPRTPSPAVPLTLAVDSDGVRVFAS